MTGEWCQHGTGPWSDAGQPDRPWWVHADPACRRPTEAWARSPAAAWSPDIPPPAAAPAPSTAPAVDDDEPGGLW